MNTNSKNKRPKLNIPKSNLEKILGIINILVILPIVGSLIYILLSTISKFPQFKRKDKTINIFLYPIERNLIITYLFPMV